MVQREHYDTIAGVDACGNEDRPWTLKLPGLSGAGLAVVGRARRMD